MIGDTHEYQTIRHFVRRIECGYDVRRRPPALDRRDDPCPARDQGETLTFEAALQSKGKPLDAPLNYSFFWQTNGMGSTYWEAPCPVPSSSLDGASTNVLFATFTPSMGA